MVKQLKFKSVWNLVTVILWGFTLTYASSEEIRKLTTNLDIQTSLEACHTTHLTLLSNLHNNEETKVNDVDDGGKLRCIALALKLWSDEEGFIVKRFIKLLNKHQKPIEISIVVDYCNSKHKQLNLNKWAEEAYYCFAQGRIGKWLSEYIKSVYKKKIPLDY